MHHGLITLIKGYQLLISPWLGQHCRFYPSCSDYALIVLRRYGLLLGGWLIIRRLFRCHPFNAGGVDPILPDCDNHSSSY